jgi:hypothetical protein
VRNISTQKRSEVSVMISCIASAMWVIVLGVQPIIIARHRFLWVTWIILSFIPVRWPWSTSRLEWDRLVVFSWTGEQRSSGSLL